jgi:hypothetical protein
MHRQHILEIYSIANKQSPHNLQTYGGGMYTLAQGEELTIHRGGLETLANPILTVACVTNADEAGEYLVTKHPRDGTGRLADMEQWRAEGDTATIRFSQEDPSLLLLGPSVEGDALYMAPRVTPEMSSRFGYIGVMQFVGDRATILNISMPYCAYMDMARIGTVSPPGS